jgi:hypothetical protein
MNSLNLFDSESTYFKIRTSGMCPTENSNSTARISFSRLSVYTEIAYSFCATSEIILIYFNLDSKVNSIPIIRINVVVYGSIVIPSSAFI